MSDKKIEIMSEFFDNRAETYDYHMIEKLDLNVFYNEIAKYIPVNRPNIEILDLGCGTGLELERVFNIYPDAEVTGVDLSSKMLDKLKEKYKDKVTQLNLVCESYFDIDYGTEIYDMVLSTYSLHHFGRELKLSLYRKIHSSLKTRGVYIEGDYTVKTMEEENSLIAEYEHIRNTNCIADGFYHFDIPFTAKTQTDLLGKAGFGEVDIVKQWDNATVFLCQKK